MPRRNRTYREGNQIVVVLNSIQHRLSEPAFIEFMEGALNTLQALAASRIRAATPPHPER